MPRTGRGRPASAGLSRTGSCPAVPRPVAYLVISDGGLGGVGETLYALDATEAELRADDVGVRLDATALRRREPLNKTGWPSALSPAHLGARGSPG